MKFNLLVICLCLLVGYSHPNQVKQFKLVDFSDMAPVIPQSQPIEKLQERKQSRKNLQKNYIPKPRIGPNATDPLPVVVFHGIKQECNEHLMNRLVRGIHEGTKSHVECIEIGGGSFSSIFMTMNRQCEEACNKIKNHDIFGKQQFNILGLSQGSLIARYIVESCDTQFPVRNLVTVGAPNNGFDFEDNCSSPEDNTRCEIQQKITGFPLLSPYSTVVQSTIGPSNYFRDHKNEQEYIDYSAFLPYLNNEKDHPKQKINKRRFEALNYLTMVKFLKDPVIYPRESSWFGQTNSDGVVIPMEETKIYKQNLFGLKTLNEENRIDKQEIDGLHLQFEHGPFIQEMFVEALLK